MKKILFSCLVLFCGLIYAAEPVSKSFFGGVAIGGYDAVAYHQPDNIKQHKATLGNSSYQHYWKEAKWNFSNKENLDKFVENPDKYAPVYNGHCSNALSLGEGLVKTDGTHWEIFSGKLHLFYSARGRNRWVEGNQIEYKKVADKAWQAIIEVY
ncbi:MAG: hypothetical protein Ctma_0762 [Catillopecten margaritatus gill symbiont]|uniref:YHS domain protein n=1 Tax=Catillopecten margaritatus gill symbiont TaxID=3083288 RepID=A0AAU6PGC5_9GAMM